MGCIRGHEVTFTKLGSIGSKDKFVECRTVYTQPAPENASSDRGDVCRRLLYLSRYAYRGYSSIIYTVLRLCGVKIEANPPQPHEPLGIVL